MNEIYELVITSSAQKEIQKLPKTEIQRIVPAIDLLSQNPRPSGCRKLVATKNSYRIRIGIIEVSGVKHRREAYE